jgi:hypothetical protein
MGLLLFKRNSLIAFFALDNFQSFLLLRTASAFLNMELVKVFSNLFSALGTQFFLILLSPENILNHSLILKAKHAKVKVSVFIHLVLTNDIITGRASLDSLLQSFALFKMFLLIDNWINNRAFFTFDCPGLTLDLMSSKLVYRVFMLASFAIDDLVLAVLNMPLELLTLERLQAMRTLSRLVAFLDMFFQTRLCNWLVALRTSSGVSEALQLVKHLLGLFDLLVTFDFTSWSTRKDLQSFYNNI